MGTIYTVVYFAVVICLFLYASSLLIAVLASLVVITQAESWEVDTKDPLNKSKKIIRKVSPFEIIVVTKGGKPKFPIIDMNEQRLTTTGLRFLDEKTKELGNKKGQWVIEVLKEKDKHGNPIPYPEIIQSKWGWLSPLYIFRKLVFNVTQRHVVRVMFPFFIAGFYELYSPHIMTFVRARSKKDTTEKIGRGTMVVLDEIYGSSYQIVQDKTDHLLYVSPMRFITNTMPTQDGYSLRADVTLLVKVVDPFQIVSIRDWSQQLANGVDNALGEVFRTGTLDTVYAVRGGGDDVRHIQNAITSNLTKPGKIVKMSLMKYLGFSLEGVTLNDLIPADDHTKKEIERIMAIVSEGRKKAEAAGMFLKSQIAELGGTDPDVRNAIASITAAQKSTGKIDWIMTPGGSGKSDDIDKAMLAFLRRIENKEGEKK